MPESTSLDRSRLAPEPCAGWSRQTCPVFPGVHETLHWGYEDPAAVEGTEEQRLAAFRSTLTMMSGRIQSFITLALRDRVAARAG